MQLLLTFLLIAVAGSSAHAGDYVKGHFRSDGAYVQPHYSSRSAALTPRYLA